MRNGGRVEEDITDEELDGKKVVREWKRVLVNLLEWMCQEIVSVSSNAIGWISHSVDKASKSQTQDSWLTV